MTDADLHRSVGARNVNTPNTLTKSDYEHYCGACTVCVDEPAEPCPECGSSPPSHGWPAIDESPYRYLGRIIEERYLLDRFLGDGATGYVYRARAMQIRRQFACKIVDTRRYNKKEFEEELLRRFRLEVEAMSRLRNPHVVAIYEAMQLSEGVFALLMDFVDGRTLQDLLDRVGRIKMERAVDIMRQVANGLFEAHRVGFIHRDLKPDNIMIERLPASGFFARILDFGIVHVMGKVDATQGFRGTPLYASPEQCMGDPRIDSRSDIYSLGCVFFHCVTGQPPFPGTESLQVMDAHVNEPPPAIRDVLNTSVIPETLEALMARMLAKDPADRPADLSEIVKALDEVTRELESPRPRRGILSTPIRGNQTMAGPGAVAAGRIATGEFPKVTGNERPVTAQTAGRSQVVAPLLQYQLPAGVADGVKAFTASALSRTAEAATVADNLNRVHVLSLKNDGVYHTLTGANGLIVSVHYSHDDGAVYASEMDGTILRWDIDTPDKPRKLGELRQRIYAIAPGLDRQILCGTENGHVISLNVDDGSPTVIVERSSPISALGLSATENRLILGYWGGNLESVHLATKATQALEPLPKNAKSIVVSKDGYLAAVLDEGGNVRILSTITGQPYFTMQASMASMRAIAFAPDGQLMGLGVMKTALQLWEIRNQPVLQNRR